jgi:NDP-sugar pyrophosphorylase family protein
MQIFIPLTGEGTRFKNAGYNRLKPFIKVHNKPIIYWVTKMFEGDLNRINLVCQNKHLNKFNYMKKELKEFSSYSKIIPINKSEKKGPVVDLMKCSDEINDHEPILISYCDYFMHWNYNKFKIKLDKLQPDGAIPCYTGFHPHLINKQNLYATCKIDKKDYLKLILEKNQFNKDKFLDNHSPGMYYFKSGKIFKKYAKMLIDSANTLNGEYYVSLIYNFLVKDKLNVWCPKNVEYFCQWGTPRDLEEYNNWIYIIKKMVKK